MRAGLSPLAPRHAWRRRTASRPIVGERNGSRTPSATSWTDPQAGERRAGASVSSGSKLDFRLEHELQPWWDGSAPPRGITRLLALRLAPEVDHRRRRARFRLPFSLRIGLPLAPLPAAPVMSTPEQSQAESVIPDRLGSIAADMPDALTGTETEPVSRFFIRPPAGNWQAAPEICPGICAGRLRCGQAGESPQPRI
jgi:hypothetical protein